MEKGKIKIKLNGFGFIKMASGKDVFFHANDLDDLNFDQLEIGDEVEFETIMAPKGKQAINTRLVDPDQLTKAKKSKKKQNSISNEKSNYRFLNPYNFVRLLPDGKINDAETKLLDRREPPPHDQFEGLSGQITCNMKTVTPLFIAGEQIVEANKHKKLKFFRAGEQLMIPASSLRGMIRNNFEAATNSCMHLMEGNKQSYHYPARDALALVPARVELEDKKWSLRLLPGTPAAVPGNPSKLQIAAWVRRYKPPIHPTRVYNLDSNLSYRERPIVPLGNLKHGDPCWAVISAVPFRRNPRPNKNEWFTFWNVENLLPIETKIEEIQEQYPGKKIEKGWLFINNQNIENKHDERFFFRSADNHEWSEKVPLNLAVREKYEALLKDYQKRHKDKIDELKEKNINYNEPYDNPPQSAFSRFIGDSNSELKDGELVYAMLSKDDPTEVEFIVPVSIPRLMYENSIEDVVKENQSYNASCDYYNTNSEKLGQLQLCPACRLFGWVRNNAETASTKKALNAYSGCLRFSNGEFTEPIHTLDQPIVLGILGSPKPTTTAFYLFSKNRKADFWTKYDSQGALIRGRKFYRHHGEENLQRTFRNDNSEWKHEYERFDGTKNRQNSTLLDALDSDNQFSFTIDFENLQPVELGALLWSCQLEENWVHRLGLAKPYGFGSLAVQEVKLALINRKVRYTSFSGQGIIEKTKNGLETEYIDLFKCAMGKRYGNGFTKLENIEDLNALLAQAPKIPVHYPRTKPEPKSKGEQFKWFVGNNRKKRQPLPLAPDDTKGFEVWNERGE